MFRIAATIAMSLVLAPMRGIHSALVPNEGRPRRAAPTLRLGSQILLP